MHPNDPANTPTAYAAPPGNFDQPPKKSWFGGCLIGCLVVSAIMALLCAGIGYFGYTQGPSILVSWGRTFVERALNESELPLQEKDAILVQFDRVGDAFVSGEVSWEEMGLLVQDLTQSPVMTLVIMMGVEHQYLDASGLSEEEKEGARQTMVRLSRGVMEDKFTGAELEGLSEHVIVDVGNNQKKPKENLTDEELRTFFEEAQDLCDEKEIPDEKIDLKLSEKIKEIVDNRLGAEEPSPPESEQ